MKLESKQSFPKKSIFYLAFLIFVVFAFSLIDFNIPTKSMGVSKPLSSAIRKNTAEISIPHTPSQPNEPSGPTAPLNSANNAGTKVYVSVNTVAKQNEDQSSNQTAVKVVQDGVTLIDKVINGSSIKLKSNCDTDIEEESEDGKYELDFSSNCDLETDNKFRSE